ncbi:unnamed protein product [Symbiodinium pilosum]|uniref:Uncharacterized protein n=1 Tax=Symbiodinium pilosum TaxID=2952 RepID=A0A812YPM1_SYMPI|nr:unnamed protein product [Symbiodinium pilosum]
MATCDLHTDRWLTAQAVWELVAWQEVSDEKVESAVALLRDWLVQGAQGDRRDGVAVELLGALPLLRLSAPQELLAPPVPAHALAILNLQKIQKVQERMAELEAENRQLRMELRRVRSGQDTSG